MPLIVSHMFVFYFGILADLTPPVALAAFAAAPIAKASGMKIGIQAVKIALAGFVIPFMAVYTPALMLQDGGPLAAAIGFPAAVAYIVVKACLAIMLWGAAAVGYLHASPRPVGTRAGDGGRLQPRRRAAGHGRDRLRPVGTLPRPASTGGRASRLRGFRGEPLHCLAAAS